MCHICFDCTDGFRRLTWRQLSRLIFFTCLQSMYLEVMCLSVQSRWMTSLLKADKNSWDGIVIYFRNPWMKILFEAEKNSWDGIITYQKPVDNEFVWGREEFMKLHNHIFQKSVDNQFVWGQAKFMRWHNHVFLGSQYLGNGVCLRLKTIH